MNEHLSVFYSVPNRARRKHSRNSISSTARYALTIFFSLKQETLQHVCHMIWQMFT